MRDKVKNIMGSPAVEKSYRLRRLYATKYPERQFNSIHNDCEERFSFRVQRSLP